MNRPGSKQRPWKRQPQEAVVVASRSRDPFYHSSRWTKESRIFRQQYPLCVKCQEKGFIVASEVTDHIIPKDICSDPWDRSNWQALCKKCNDLKSSEDKKQIQIHRKTYRK
jgi:5-methylcytosine-specific restriction endonuclease McrA